MFRQTPQNVQFPEQESKVLDFWNKNQIYEKSLQLRKDSPKFVFFEGPPTANGMPHPGHCLTRAIKDLFPRYRTMRGYYCERKAGWDTHGLPVEVEVCKEMGIHSKEEIEEFGIEPFIHKCQASVWRYMKEWERMTQRLGFWIHLEDAYVTYHQSYIESVWWSLKNLFDRDLLYQGHKIVWWWAQGGTALSAGEVGEGRREVADPSVFVRFPLLDDSGNKTDESMLVWTTTPWTLPSNQFAAIHPDLEYSTVQDEETGEKLILASALVEAVGTKAKKSWSVVATCQGSDLLGKRYEPPFDYYYSNPQQDGAWRVVKADFVTTTAGTGIVHIAPAFGEDDYNILIEQRSLLADGKELDLICAVGPDGKFTAEVPEYQGRWVKEADKDITRELKQRGVLFLLDQYLHDYPFCWRAKEDPLIQYPRESWFIRTTKFKDQMLANNQKINWMPEHIKDGRFGNFLEGNVDWSLSRERYWGTPLPIWVCEKTGKQEAVGDYDELEAKPGATGFDVWEKAKAKKPDLAEDLKIHKPYIDAITYNSPFAEGARMNRVPEVIDCWYDSGAMPFAQWGYPKTNKEHFQSQFPADFISEAIDQTRGWFYSQLAISTMLFGNGEAGQEQQEFPHPFKNCIVLGLMLGEDGKKMSKRDRNYRDPEEIFDKYGADALRWFLFSNQPPWSPIQYKEKSIKDSIPEFLLRLWNVYSFFVIYANIDGFEPENALDGEAGQLNEANLANAKGFRPVSERSELDRWVLSELNMMLETVVEKMDAYDNYNACNAINSFVDALSNWYVRRSRDRYWSKDKQSPDKLDAYWTLYECMITISKVIAPFVPFMAENLWSNLATGIFGDRAVESVHLCDYPEPDNSVIDRQLSQRMDLLREIASLGRNARMNEKLKVRQPLTLVEVILADTEHQEWLQEHAALICEELNVKEVQFTQNADQYINYQVQPNFKRLGKRVGKLIPQVKKALGEADGAALMSELQDKGNITLTLGEETVELDAEDVQVRLQAKPGWAAAQGNLCVVVLNTELSDELIREGYSNDLVRFVQDRRKELDLDFTARIEIGVVIDSAEVKQGITENLEHITSETLANSLEFKSVDGAETTELTLGDFALTLSVKKASEG